VDLTRRDCDRRSRHRFGCTGSVIVENDEGYLVAIYEPAAVRVRFASRHSYAVRTRVHSVRRVF
jgi:hypothetical protein